VKAVDDVLQPLPLVLEVNHVRLGEHGAPAGDAGRRVAPGAKADEVPQGPVDLIRRGILFRRVDGGGQSLGLLIDKGPCPGRAGPVAVEVVQFPSPCVMMDLEKRRVLTAHADDASCIRSQIERAHYLADRLEFIEAARPFADLPAVVSRKGKGGDILPSQPLLQVLNQAAGFMLHAAEVASVRRLIEDLPVRIDGDRVEADRSRVDSHVAALALHRSSRSLLVGVAEDRAGRFSATGTARFRSRAEQGTLPQCIIGTSGNLQGESCGERNPAASRGMTSE